MPFDMILIQDSYLIKETKYSPVNDEQDTKYLKLNNIDASVKY